MSSEFGDFMTLVQEGKIEEARALIETQRAKLKYSPDTIRAAKGKPPRFTKKGKRVELGDNGKWRLQQ